MEINKPKSMLKNRYEQTRQVVRVYIKTTFVFKQESNEKHFLFRFARYR